MLGNVSYGDCCGVSISEEEIASFKIIIQVKNCTVRQQFKQIINVCIKEM